MSANQPAASREFTGRHMLLLALGFFGTIVAVNVSMAVLAATSWTGLVVANSYVASQEFEAKRLAHEAQLAAGWQATFVYGSGRAELAVVDGAGNAIGLGSIVLDLSRPVGGHDDQTVELARNSSGRYAASVTLGDGVWDAVVTAPATALGPFEIHRRFRVRGEP